MGCQSQSFLDSKEVHGYSGRQRRPKVQSEYFQDHVDQIRENKVVFDLTSQVYIDPNRRDLLYCLGSNDLKLRYTSMQRRKETGSKGNQAIIIIEHSRIRHTVEHDFGLHDRIPTVPSPPRSTLNLHAFRLYLYDFFNNTRNMEETYQLRIFRRLRFSTYVRTQKSEQEFVKKVKMKFGQPANTTILIGDWSQNTAKFHMPTKISGFRKMFTRAGFNVLLVNEFKTSSICPDCNAQSLEIFRHRPSPRPWRQNVLVPVHGLLRCSSENCQFVVQNQVPRVWNRDDVATRNIRSIVEETIATRNRPARFCRNPPNQFSLVYLINSSGVIMF